MGRFIQPQPAKPIGYTIPVTIQGSLYVTQEELDELSALRGHKVSVREYLESSCAAIDVTDPDRITVFHSAPLYSAATKVFPKKAAS